MSIASSQDFFQQRDQLVTVLIAQLIRCESRIDHEGVGNAQDSAKPFPESFGANGHNHHIVPGSKRLIWANSGMRVAESSGTFAVGEVTPADIGEPCRL